MRVNKERVDKVIAAIEDIAASGTRYTFDEFCTQHNLYGDNYRTRVDSVMICCPFHKENHPSLIIDEGGRRWHCFGGCSGRSYTDFLVNYDKFVLGVESSTPKKVNELLKNDSALRARVGFDTIYESEQQTTFEPMKIQAFKIKKVVPTTFPELASWLQQKHYSKQMIIFAISLMQNGLSPEMIYQQVVDFKEPVAKKQYSISELNKETDDE